MTTRNPIHERVDEALCEYLQIWFDELASDGWSGPSDSFEDRLDDAYDRVMRGRSADADRENYQEWAEAKHYGSKAERVTIDPDAEREEYVADTYGELKPLQVLQALADNGWAVDTYGYGIDGKKEGTRLPG